MIRASRKSSPPSRRSGCSDNRTLVAVPLRAVISPRICLAHGTGRSNHFGDARWSCCAPGPFRRYIVGSAISDTGTWMQVMAQGWVMSSLTDKALLLGMVNFAAGIPTIALTMIGGSAADRYDKRKILIATQVVQIGSPSTLGCLGSDRAHSNLARHRARRAASASASRSRCRRSPRSCRSWSDGPNRDRDRAGSLGLSRLAPGRTFRGRIVRGVVGRGLGIFRNAVSFFALIDRADFAAGPRKIGTAEEEEQRRSGFKEGLRYVAARSHHPLHDRD